jgi:hypothetical protein
VDLFSNSCGLRFDCSTNLRNPEKQETVQVSQPYGQRIVTFTIARLNKLSNAPIIENNPNETLSDASVVTYAPTLYKDGITRLYRISGQYVYDQSAPVYETDGLDMGASPADVGSVNDFVFDGTQFTRLSSRGNAQRLS